MDGVAFGIAPRVFDGGRHDLRADELFRIFRHRKPDRARAAVEVEQRLRAGQPRVFGGLAVKALGLRAVHLVKRVRRDLEGEAAERVGDRVLAPERAARFAEHDVRLFAVDVEQDAGDFRHGLAQHLDEQRFLVQRGAVCDDADHHLAAHFPAAHVQVAEHAAVRRFVVDAFARHGVPPAERGGGAVKRFGLQQAAFRVHDAVGVDGVKAELQRAVPRKADGKLALVAVAAAARCGEDRLHLKILQAADALERVAHALRLDLKLRFVADVPVHAAAALRGDGAVRRDAVGRGREQLFEPAEGVLPQDLDDAHGAPVADGGARHEDSHALDTADAAALGRHGGDIGFKNIVFPDHAKTSGETFGPKGRKTQESCETFRGAQPEKCFTNSKCAKPVVNMTIFSG